MGRAVMFASLDQVHDLLQQLVDAELAECEISVLFPGTNQDALALSGLEPLLEAGSVVAALGGQRDRASIEDVVEILIELGVPEGEAEEYGRRVKRGEVLISVRCADESKLEGVREIARHVGAEMVEDCR